STSAFSVILSSILMAVGESTSMPDAAAAAMAAALARLASFRIASASTSPCPVVACASASARAAANLASASACLAWVSIAYRVVAVPAAARPIRAISAPVHMGSSSLEGEQVADVLEAAQGVQPRTGGQVHAGGDAAADQAVGHAAG